MKVSNGLPPNIELIKKVFPIKSNTIFTYGDTIFIQNIKFETIPQDLLAHEKIHIYQQGDNPDAWWDQYLKDINFRLNQEAEAYREQYKFYCRAIKDRTRRFKFLGTLANDFSGPLYGKMLTYFEAVDVISKGVGNDHKSKPRRKNRSR